MPVFLGTVSSTMTQDYYKSETTKRYDIPLAHLDYGYIRSCSDVKELEKILRVLRWVWTTGQEDTFSFTFNWDCFGERIMWSR